MRPLALLFLVCCAVANAEAQNVRVRIGVLGHAAPLALDSLASVFEVAASRGATFAAVAAVLTELRVPIDTRDSARGITALAFVDAKDSANTVLRVAMLGGAEDIQGSSKDPVACGSTGGFENFLFDRVKKRLAWPKS